MSVVSALRRWLAPVPPKGQASIVTVDVDSGSPFEVASRCEVGSYLLRWEDAAKHTSVRRIVAIRAALIDSGLDVVDDGHGLRCVELREPQPHEKRGWLP